MFENTQKTDDIFYRELCFGESVRQTPRGELCKQLRELCKTGVEVFVDTCSLLCESGLVLLETVEQVFPEYGKRLNIFSSVLAEVEKVGNKIAEKKRTSNLILNKLRRLAKKGIVKILDHGNKSFSDVNFLAEFIIISSQKKENNKMLLITQDRALAEKTNNLSSYLGEVVKNKSRCEARRLTNNGRLERFTAVKKPHSNNKKAKKMEDINYDECKILFGPLFRFR